MSGLSRKLLVEFIGTFTLIFLGAGAGTVAGMNVGGGLITVALAHGLTVMFCAYAFGHISGSHINPAVSIGLLAAGKMSGRDTIAYVITQIVAGIAGAALLAVVFSGQDVSLGATNMSEGTSTVAAMILEAIGAFLLVSVILQTAVAGRAGNLAPLAIGMTLAANIMFFGPLTGASLNPARTIGPALMTGQMDSIVIYSVATILGGVLAGLLFRSVLAED